MHLGRSYSLVIRLADGRKGVSLNLGKRQFGHTRGELRKHGIRLRCTASLVNGYVVVVDDLNHPSCLVSGQRLPQILSFVAQLAIPVVQTNRCCHAACQVTGQGRL